MMTLFILEVFILPLNLLSVRILHSHGLLTENKFGLIVSAYLSIMTITASNFFPAVSAGRIICDVLTFLCWFPGYSIAKQFYRRIYLRSK
jgi:hypothetical protein